MNGERHPDESTLAALLDGELAGADWKPTVEHLADCPECRAIVSHAARVRRRYRRSRQRARLVPSVAAAAVVALLAVPLTRNGADSMRDAALSSTVDTVASALGPEPFVDPFNRMLSVVR